MTSMLAGIAHRIARHDRAVRDHAWLATATEYSWRGIRDSTGQVTPWSSGTPCSSSTPFTIRCPERTPNDGGWTVDWGSFSAAGTFEWRGWATVRALKVLRSNDRG